MKPTAEQTAIKEAAKTTARNLLVNARAGAAKTTTIELIAKELPEYSILAIAFNKKIADTLSERLPSNCTCMTLNSLGNRMFRDYIGRWPKLEKRKTYLIVKDLIEALPEDERGLGFDIMSECLEGVRAAKAAGYIPPGVSANAKSLCATETFYSEVLEFEPTPLHTELIEKTLRINYTQAVAGVIDFDDQIYFPALLPCSFSAYDLTLVDEAQDLSPVNHVLLSKVVRKKRIIAVGDPCQAIYGFRGASQSSMEELRVRFDMQEYFLTICFRSAKEIIRNARWRAPDMVWRDGAPEGIVRRLQSWSVEDVKDGGAIICRNNAPLFRMAINLLSAGRSPELLGNDIVVTLTNIMKKLGKPTSSRDEAIQALEDWREKQEKKRRDGGRVHDQYECLKLFIDNAETLGGAMTALEEVCNRSGRIKLMTGHKSKGLEFDTVFFLDDWLCDRKRGQDANIEYVIETRARERLFYVQSNDWIRADEAGYGV